MLGQSASARHADVHAERPSGQVHPPVVRVMHWLNAIVMIIMIGSGWRIYNDSPLIPGFEFPNSFNLGGDPGVSDQKWQNHASGGLLWHFAGMWLLVLNGLAYLSYTALSGRFRRMMLPITLDGIMVTVKETLAFRLNHEHGIYNHVQRLLYVGVIVLILIAVLSGLAMWKQVQFPVIASLFVTFQGARWAHFLAMAGIVGFLIVHVALALLVPRTLVSMTVGDQSPMSHQRSEDRS